MHYVSIEKRREESRLRKGNIFCYRFWNRKYRLVGPLLCRFSNLCFYVVLVVSTYYLFSQRYSGRICVHLFIFHYHAEWRTCCCPVRSYSPAAECLQGLGMRLSAQSGILSANKISLRI